MHNSKTQILFKTATLLLVFTLLIPSAVKFMHLFSHHEHEICNGEIRTHLHKADFDCSFHKFKLSAPYTIPNFEYVFLAIEDNHKIYEDAYYFLSDYQQLHFSLRGPPQIDLA